MPGAVAVNYAEQSGPDALNYNYFTPSAWENVPDFSLGSVTFNEAGANSLYFYYEAVYIHQPTEPHDVSDIIRVIDNQSIVFPTASSDLFTTGADTVDFNNLTAEQQQAIASGADTTHGLGGNDNVTLPNSGSATFDTGSTASDTNYRVTGGSGNYNITEGKGTEFITINGNGSSTLTAGPGSDTVSISGGGTLKITGSFQGPATIGTGSTLELNGPDTGSITFTGADATLKIDGTSMPNSVIKGFAIGDVIDLPGVSYNSHEFTELLNQQQNLLNVYANGNATTPSAQLHLDPSQSYFGDWFNISPDAFGGTKIQLAQVQSVQMNIVLGAGGYGTLTATVNGQTIPGMSAIVYCAYDDLNPIPSGSYTLLYRTNSSAGDGNALEFDSSPGVSELNYASGVQIHLGNTPGDSVGCIVFGNSIVNGQNNAGSWTAFEDFFNSITSPTAFSNANGFVGFPAPVSITATLSGDTAQPTLEIIPSASSITTGDSVSINFRISGLQPSAPVVDKDINVYFQVIGTNETPSLVSGATLLAKYTTSNNVVLQNVYKVTIVGSGQNNNPPGSADVAITLNTAGITANSLTVKIVQYDGVSEETNGKVIGYDPTGVTENGVTIQPLLLNSEPATISLIPSAGGLEDGYISGATIFVDVNRDGELNPGEPFTGTNSDGTFSLGALASSGLVVAIGGTDISTGLPFKGQLSAPAGSTIITPLTTLLTSVGDQNKVLTALGLPAGIDLTTLDPIAATKAGDAHGAAAYVAGAKVYDTVAMIASALAGAGGNLGTASKDAFGGIAAAISGSGINLDDKSSLTALINNVVQTEHLTLGSGVADNLATLIAAGNTALDQKLAADGAGPALLNDVAAIELIAQGAEASAVQSAIAHPDQLSALVNVFTGSSLNSLITNAGNQVANLGQNQAPLSFDGKVSTNEDTLLSGSLLSIDLNSDPLTYSLVGAAPTGLVLKSDGSFSFDPRGHYDFLEIGESATVSFQFKANDGKAGSNVATETITITGVNDAPMTTADLKSVQLWSALSADKAHGVLANDSDPDLHDFLNVSSVSFAGTTKTIASRRDSYASRNFRNADDQF